MKAMIEFALPEEDVEYSFAYNGKLYWNALYDIKSHISQIQKYGTEKPIDQILEDLNNLIPYQVDEVP